MLNSCSSNAILTKIRAILGKRLTYADYAQMARKRDVGEVAALLKENPSYAIALRNIDEGNVHRGQLEELLKKDLFYKYSALRRYDFSGGTFYDFPIMQREIDEIIRRIVLLQADENTDFVVDLPSYMLGHTSFPLMDLARARNFEELLECVAHTPYQGILKGLGPKDIQSLNVMNCEHALYSYYYKTLHEAIQKQFYGETRQQLLEAADSEIELQNIQNIFRLKLYFHYDEPRIRQYLYPYSHRYHKAQIDALIRAEDFAQMFQILAPEENEDAHVLEEDGIEPYTNRLCYQLERRLLRFTTKAPVAMFTFLTLRRIEVQNIIMVIEGVRYQMPQDEILKMLIL
ncbi:MAG TPA: V-type ATPase subunit [Candidatus Merdivicinus excrementipullorum]|uniref:V-type ATPase subunit n=1 Tax=Candidatus Merdivicinus excrementipullorum TaxID=2840867 RepID=A0A9D1FPP5_9FIRM|nr:V-type ATPase subunit [Candidatus Merdivicinus excrementipullorum]